MPSPIDPGQCSRRLDVPNAEGDDAYAGGQPVRFAAWNLVMGSDIARGGATLLDARSRVLGAPRVFANDLVLGRDATPSERAELDAIEAASTIEMVDLLGP